MNSDFLLVGILVGGFLLWLAAKGRLDKIVRVITK